MSPAAPRQPSVALTGFMGAGKSSVGRRLAERLQRPFVDVDERLEERFGRPVAEVFAREGEAAFREAEAELVQELAHGEGQVVALGGGALLDPESRRRWLERHSVVTLQVSAPLVLERLRGQDDRPLLSADPAQRASDLLQARRAVYAASPLQVDTRGRTLEEVTTAVADLLDAEAAVWERSEVDRLVVDTADGAYPVWVGRGLAERLGDVARARGLGPGDTLVVDDEHTASWGETVLRSLGARGYSASHHTLPPGEQHKTPATLAELWSAAARSGLARDRFLVAVGGGVVGDLTGFAAATFMRGVGFLQVPTSLLAMVDASVGGKTAVDLPEGKNLAGAFHQPLAVVVDPDTLGTLPESEVTGGLAEVAKHALLGDPELLALLEAGRPPLDAALLRRAIAVKARIVEQDVREGGPRAHLNLGHTFGHALEALSGYALGHGPAVAVGMLAAAHLAERLDVGSPELTRRTERLLAGLGLPTRAEGFRADALVRAMATDKKRSEGRLRVVVLEEPGQAKLVAAPDDATLAAAWRAVGAE